TIKGNDEDIINYLLKENGNFQEELHENMILVNGGKYIPNFFMKKRNVFDLYVGKYSVT
ncbi:hypothetical protein H6A04_11475, partial [Fusobacterium mortiferum]|nr:hypothetical protein [Fusobacterium mortiferum]